MPCYDCERKGKLKLKFLRAYAIFIALESWKYLKCENARVPCALILQNKGTQKKQKVKYDQ